MRGFIGEDREGAIDVVINPNTSSIVDLSRNIEVTEKDVPTRPDQGWSPVGPDVLPPRIPRNTTKFGSMVFESPVPGMQRSLIDFTVKFVRVTVNTQSL